MKKKDLLIVFAKNKLIGKVKTRLAKDLGDQVAYDVYEHLYHLTERETTKLKDIDVQIHFSHEIAMDAWPLFPKFIQVGDTLGDRMKHAFKSALAADYDRIIGIGADLPDLTSDVITSAFEKLRETDFVFGPAEDGGYYLVGMNAGEHLFIFDEKPWSTPELLDVTKKEISEKKKTVSFLKELNDIDTIDDLRNSSIAEQFETVIHPSE